VAIDFIFFALVASCCSCSGREASHLDAGHPLSTLLFIGVCAAV